MRLSFDSIDEVREFVKGLKGTRGGKGGDADDSATGGQGQPGNTAPAPLNPPTGAAAFNPGGFAPGAAGFTPPGPAPEVMAYVTRIIARLDTVLAPPPAGMGQDINATLGWFRQQCGPEAAQAGMDQIKQLFLPKMSVPSLENIAKLIGA